MPDSILFLMTVEPPMNGRDAVLIVPLIFPTSSCKEPEPGASDRPAAEPRAPAAADRPEDRFEPSRLREIVAFYHS